MGMGKGAAYRAVNTSRKKENSSEAGSEACGAQVDRVADQEEDAAAEDEGTPPPNAVRLESGDEEGSGGPGVDGDGQQLGVHADVAEPPDDGREEGHEAEEREADGELQHGVQVHLGVPEGGTDLGPAELVLDGQVRVELEAEPHDPPLLLVQEPRRARVLGEHAPDDGDDRHGDDALDDEEPRPRRQPARVQVADGGRQQPADGPRQRTEAVHDGRAHGHLGPQVHHAEVGVDAGDQAGLEEPDEEPAGVQLAHVGDEAHAQADGAPAQKAGGEEVLGPYELQGYGAGGFEGDVCCEEEGDGVAELVALKVQILWEAHDVRVALLL